MPALLQRVAPAGPRNAAIAPDAARAHLDSLWDRLLDIEGPGKADPSPA